MDRIHSGQYNKLNDRFQLNIVEQFDGRIENVCGVLRKLYDEVDIIDFQRERRLDELIENHGFLLTIVDVFELYEEIHEGMLNIETNYDRSTMEKENQRSEDIRHRSTVRNERQLAGIR